LLLLQIPPALFLRYIYMDIDPPAAEGGWQPTPKPWTPLTYFCHGFVIADPSRAFPALHLHGR
jgi:hypothetical protein